MRISTGKCKGRIIISPKSSVTRPTSGMLREAVFNICQNDVHGSQFLDIFAGSGAMGLEAISRGADSAVFIDSSKDSIKCIQKNLQMLGIEPQGLLLEGDVFKLLALLERRKNNFSIIYADPPYDAGWSQKILDYLDKSSLLMEGGNLFIEDGDRVLLDYAHLQTLTFKSNRKMGRARLCHFMK